MKPSNRNMSKDRVKNSKKDEHTEKLLQGSSYKADRRLGQAMDKLRESESKR